MVKKISVSKYLSYLFLIVVSAIWLIPLIFGFSTSFRSQTEIVSAGFRLLPVNGVVENYLAIFSDTSTAPIVKGIGNSLFIAITHKLLVVLVISFTAFGYSLMYSNAWELLIFTFIAISFFSYFVNLIPSNKIIDVLGWVNTPWAMIVPGLAAMGNIFLVRQFMKNIPRELDESARVDGASDFQIYSRIILPSIK